MKFVVYGLIVLLAFLHQDVWWWDRIDPLILGFVPIGLAYQAGISVVAAILWALAVKFCWPENLEDEGADSLSAGSSAGDDA